MIEKQELKIHTSEVWKIQGSGFIPFRSDHSFQENVISDCLDRKKLILITVYCDL